ncbi:hypothetical protein VKT23_006665 [Stygiomarasmius scandens]|uniref:DUF7726 domain-containing protein n=1 Tax=Marasmiellus scandens TaxID=2682957 RepID=A0ABR1JNF8_9AGAR
MFVLKNGERIGIEELPNPVVLTDQRNLEWLRKREEEIDASKAASVEKGKDKKATKHGRSTADVTDDANSDDGENASQGASSKKVSSKRPREDDNDNDAPNTSKPAKKTAKTKELTDLFSISLDGDDDGTVEIYDNCDQVRRKINQHLTKSGVKKAQFMRDIARAAYPSTNPTPSIQSKQLSDFLTKRGPTAGSTSRVFYAAYVYFEKMRLSEGKPKSAHRLEMEKQWDGKGGLPRERERGYFVPQGYEVVQDKTGAVRTQKM